MRFLVLAAILPAAVFSSPALGQGAAAADVLILANGDQLTGKLVGEANGTITFHSDMAGDLTFTWDKVKSIRTSGKFAVIEQGQHISRKTPDNSVALGTVAIDGNTIRSKARKSRKRMRSTSSIRIATSNKSAATMAGDMVGEAL